MGIRPDTDWLKLAEQHHCRLCALEGQYPLRTGSLRDKLELDISVTLALIDLLRPGDTAIDIGANVGDLSIIVSRLVGPLGRVFAIEANGNTAEQASANLRTYNCFNTFLINRAAAARSNENTVIYLGDGPNDSLIQWPWIGKETLPVVTVAVDDLVEYFRLRPRVLKIDVEGFELEVLKGASGFLSAGRPVLILEQTDNDEACIRFLTDLGYHMYCLGSYRRIRNCTDYYRSGDAYVRNVVAYHPQGDSHLGTGFASLDAIEREEVCCLSAKDFRAEGPWLRSERFALPAGRYAMEHYYRTEAAGDIELGLVAAPERFVGRYYGDSAWLEHLPDLPMHLDDPCEVSVALHCRDGLNAQGRLMPLEFRLFRISGIPAFRPGLLHCI